MTGIIRVDPCRSKVFSWISYDPDAPEVRDEATGRLIQPQGPAITARYRTTGMEITAWPITEDEARRIMLPGQEFDYSSGRAWSQIVMPYANKRMVKSGQRQETVKQREEAEQRAGRRWLA
jgi:hypothetical protein